MPTKTWAAKKKKSTTKKIKTYVYDDKEVEAKVQRNRARRKAPVNVAMEKASIVGRHR